MTEPSDPARPAADELAATYADPSRMNLRIITPEEHWADYEKMHKQPRPWTDDCDDISVWSYTDPLTDEDRWSWACRCGAPHPQPPGFRGYDAALEAVDALREHVTSKEETP